MDYIEGQTVVYKNNIYEILSVYEDYVDLINEDGIEEGISYDKIIII